MHAEEGRNEIILMDDYLAGSSLSDRYDVLKKLCRQQLLVDSYNIPPKSRKEIVTNHAGFVGSHSQGRTDFEYRASMDTDFEDLELPVTSRVKSPLRSPNPPHFEEAQSRLYLTSHPNDRTHHLPTSSPSSCANNAIGSDVVWPPTTAASDSPPPVTTLPRAAKPTTLLTNSLVVSSTPLLSQRPTLVTSHPMGATRLQSTAVGMAPPIKLNLSGPSRPRLITNVSILGKSVPSVQQRPSIFTTSVIPGQQRIVIQTSGGNTIATQSYPRPPVSAQNPIRNSPSENL